jgi:hypothetical protein
MFGFPVALVYLPVMNRFHHVQSEQVLDYMAFKYS